MQFGNSQPPEANSIWRQQLDQFVQANQQALAAIAWGLRQERSDRDETLGIDLKPTPHFVCCAKEAIEILNRKVNNELQEILGIIDGHNPEQEVVILGIGEGQIKLIHFQPDPSPAQCFEQLGSDVAPLITQLEEQLAQRFGSISSSG